MATSTGSGHSQLRRGPVWPKPVSDVYTNPGLISARAG